MYWVHKTEESRIIINTTSHELTLPIKPKESDFITYRNRVHSRDRIV